MKEDLVDQMKYNFLHYASYVILDRAIPDLADGLKPVQRRILHTLFKIHDGKLHKVANIVGQTMAFHPHGDAPINDALINVANKGYLIDRQGNFGNILTGDPAAAARYIEARLSPLAHEALFNPLLTDFVPSYDGRNKEPLSLPAKIPVLLMHGAEGIAVGMSTRILPHNFVELLEAEIAILENKEYQVFPDFLTGGIMDASEYRQGKGRVKLRTKMRVPDEKTIIIEEICHGTSTESLIRSIDEAAKKGKIKIDSISDYTADKVEIEIKLPRGQYASKTIDQLYAYTDCEVSLNSLPMVIKDQVPCEMDIPSILEYHVERLKGYLRTELELEHERLLEKIFQKTLEQIFIENRLYKKIEDLKTYEKIHESIEKGLKPYYKYLNRDPVYEDREYLLNIPIRRISRFDLDKNREEITKLEERIEEIEKDLRNIKKVTIRYLKNLIKKYGKDFPRRTRRSEIEEIDKKAMATENLTVGFDTESGFIGTKVKSETSFECTNFDKILILFKNGTHKVINVPEKEYSGANGKDVVYVGIADKKTTFSVVYKDPKTKQCYGKRFIVKKFIIGRDYSFLPEGQKLEYLTTHPSTIVSLEFTPKPKQKVKRMPVDLSAIAEKGVSAKGIRLSAKEVKKVKLLKQETAEES
ncbi:MAG: DNA topoisomerase IV [Waddliaceae bacterium]|nr:DNA topoisomerase IV [Waddliaceae bacterium]